MARTQSRYYPNNEIFRAKVETLDNNGDSYTDSAAWSRTFGPYASAATAKGVASQKTRYRGNTQFKVTIQKAVTVWEDVE